MKDHYFDRDLSWLGFNSRILDEAARAELPLMERFRFLSIYSSNLDEFYRVRFPVIKALQALKDKKRLSDAELEETTADLAAVRNTINAQQNRFGEVLRKQLIPALGEFGIRFIYGTPLPEEIQSEVTEVFFNRILGYLQPVPLKESGDRFFPENNKLYFLVVLNNGNRQRQVVINIPSKELDRFYLFRSSAGNCIVFLDDIIRHHLSFLFPEETSMGCFSVKVTRDATLLPEDDFGSDLAELIEKQLSKRDFGLVTRFIHAPDLPAHLLKKALRYLEIDESSAVCGGHYHNLADLSSIPLDGDGFVYQNWTPHQSPAGSTTASIFDQLLTNNLFIHTPYQSYEPVIRFFNEAANHPDITEICTTVYRIASDSRIGHALISAAKNGKRVRVLVELKARFDEHNNLRWAKQMQEAGVEILYSSKKQKVHSKITLVRMAGQATSVYYGLISTGNFNERTANRYTDIVQMTADQELLQEVKKVFTLLAKKKKPSSVKKAFSQLIVAPFNLRTRFIELIAREIEHARAGKKAAIFIKVNNLEERTLISKLYEASQAGVEINMLVRSVCCLIPGVVGLSERIKVRRLVDRYLEHSRVFHFYNHGADDIYIGSADWMNRNVYHRVEVCTPVKDRRTREHLLQCIELWKSDHLEAVTLNSRLENVYAIPAKKALQAQSVIHEMLRPTLSEQPLFISNFHDIRKESQEDQQVC